MIRLEFIEELIILLAGAVLIILISRPLRIPSIVGFLITGMLIGPTGLDFIRDKHLIEMYAELGVVMLLFFIGIEFSLAHLRTIWKQFLAGGAGQVLATTIIVLIIFGLGPFSLAQRILFGFLVALSSTAIALKTLDERGEVDTPQGRLAIAICLFQDFAIVPMIVVTPLLAGGAETLSWDLALDFAMGVLIVIAIIVAARYLLPRALAYVVHTRVREAFLLAAILMCLVLAHVTASLGFSYALGAFIAGLLVSESEYSHEVTAEIVSFRDLFSSLFFISIGMLLDLSFVADSFISVLGISVGIFLVKALVVMIIAVRIRLSARSAIIAALTLAQVGEFSFVLSEVGVSSGLLNPEEYQYFLSASIFTMIVSPPLINLAPIIAERAQHLLPIRRAPVEGETHISKPLKDHVIIAGYGVNGRNLARVLKETGISYVVLDAEPDSYLLAGRDGHPAVYGDVTRREILSKCAITKARFLVFAISDPSATRASVRIAKAMNSHVNVIVRTRFVAEVNELARLGADEVIPEEFETSIEIFARVLDHYHIPRNVINAQIKIIRDENYGMLRGLPQMEKGLDRVAELLAAGTSDTFLVTSSCHAVGKTLADLNFRGRTGATIIAVVRGEKSHVSPPPEFRIEAGDNLVIVGNHASMDKAFEYLETPPEGSSPGNSIPRKE